MKRAQLVSIFCCGSTIGRVAFLTVGGFEPSNGQLNLARMWSHHLVETGNPFSAMRGEVGFSD